MVDDAHSGAAVSSASLNGAQPLGGESLRDRVALVTGGANGIGAAIAQGLAAQGALVVVSDVDPSGARQVATEICSRFGEDRAVSVALDVTCEAQWQAAVAACRDRFGSLRILVNNAGMMALGSVEDLELDAWRKSMAINVDGPFLGCKHALPLMRLSPSGSIINISSISAMVASHNMAAYNASKAAVWMLTKSVALHCAKQGYNIRANSVHPTFVRTALLDGFVGDRNRDDVLAKLARQVPTGRMGEVEDVVAAVIYLASDNSSMMTASELKLDGGLSAM